MAQNLVASNTIDTETSPAQTSVSCRPKSIDFRKRSNFHSQTGGPAFNPCDKKFNWCPRSSTSKTRKPPSGGFFVRRHLFLCNDFSSKKGCVRDWSQVPNATKQSPHPPRFCFTLRALFIATSLASAAAWLYIRYRHGPVGFPFPAMVLGAGWCVLRDNRLEAAAWLAAFAVVWTALQFFGPYTTLRKCAVLVGTDWLQQWAREVLDDPPLPVGETGLGELDPESLPQDIRSLAGTRIDIFIAGDETESWISLRHGGGFYYWGLRVGRPGYTPSDPNQCDKIADGIWGFQGGG